MLNRIKLKLKLQIMELHWLKPINQSLSWLEQLTVSRTSRFQDISTARGDAPRQRCSFHTNNTTNSLCRKQQQAIGENEEYFFGYTMVRTRRVSTQTVAASSRKTLSGANQYKAPLPGVFWNRWNATGCSWLSLRGKKRSKDHHWHWPTHKRHSPSFCGPVSHHLRLAQPLHSNCFGR